MKKAKIMLLAIAVTGVVSGALAFKASKFGGAQLYCAATAQPVCDITLTPAPGDEYVLGSGTNSGICTLKATDGCNRAAVNYDEVSE